MRPGKIQGLTIILTEQVQNDLHLCIYLNEERARCDQAIVDYATLLTTLSEEAEARGLIPTIVSYALNAMLEQPEQAARILFALTKELEGR